MAIAYDHVDAVGQRANADDGSLLLVWLAVEGAAPRPFGFSPRTAADMLTALHFLSQQAETIRDKAGGGGHAVPHAFLSVLGADVLELSEPEKIGVCVTLRNNSRLDLVLSADTARALRDQLDAALFPSSAPPGAAH